MPVLRENQGYYMVQTHSQLCTHAHQPAANCFATCYINFYYLIKKMAKCTKEQVKTFSQISKKKLNETFFRKNVAKQFEFM